jgi:hypothetical protein
MSAKYSKDLARLVRDYLETKEEHPPTLAVIEKLFEVMFFASLQREEAQLISCRVALVNRDKPDPDPPERIVADRWSYFPLSEELPFTVSNLVKLSQAVDPWGSTMAVHADSDGKLSIWGLIDQSLHFSTYLVKESDTGVEMPGIFQASIIGVGEIAAYRRDVLVGHLRYDSLLGRQHRVFEAGPLHAKMMPWIERFQRRVIEKANQEAYRSRDHWDDSLEDFWSSALCRLLIGIHRYGHGGAVLISDQVDGLTPKYSLRYPRLADALVRLGTHQIDKTFYSDVIMEKFVEQDIEDMPVDLYLADSVESDELADTKGELKGCIRFLTSLSRVDGLLWLDTGLELRAFGVEVAEREDPPKVCIAQNTDGSERKTVDLNQYGMRHRSMIRYCGFNPEAVGFVVSQDGGLKAVTKVDDSVLMWDRVRIHSLRMPKTSRQRKRKIRKKRRSK